MARKNWFIGRSQEWLQKELEKAQNDLAAGKTLSSWGQGGDSAAKQIQKTAEERIGMLLVSLSIVDPETYPPEEVQGQSISLVSFRGGCE